MAKVVQNIEEYTGKLFTQSSVNALILTGILMFLIHPFALFGYEFPDLGVLAWVHLIPLIIGIHRRKLTHKFLLCLLSCSIGYYGNMYWLLTAMLQFGGLNFFQAIIALTVLILLLSFIFAMLLSAASWVNHLVKIPFFLLLPIFLTTRDVVLHNFPFNGFPWAITPYSQGEWIQYFQWLDVTGVFGLGFFIYLINGLLADGILLFINHRQLDKMVSRFLVAFVLLLLSLYGSFLSSQNYEKYKVSAESINIGLVQPNIPQDQKWLPYKAQDNLNVHLRLTKRAVKDGADIVFWPETSFPYGLNYPKFVGERFLNKEKLSSPILFGAVVAEKINGEIQIFNSVVHADESARMHEPYRKIHLVPFGEYLPFEEHLGFLKSLTQGVGQFDPGREYLLFNVKGVQLATLICFEDVFPQYARLFAKMSGDMIINYTNDAWYGKSSMHSQHTVYSQFRALENRRFVLRTTNNGMTAVINPKGEIVKKFEQYKEGYLLSSIKIDKGYSIYTQIGDFWVFGIVMLCALILIYTVIKIKLGPVKKEF